MKIFNDPISRFIPERQSAAVNLLKIEIYSSILQCTTVYNILLLTVLYNPPRILTVVNKVTSKLYLLFVFFSPVL